MLRGQNLVDRERIELSISGCKPDVFPLALTAQITDYLSYCTPSVKAKFGAPEESRTPKIWLLRPTRIPIPSPGQFGSTGRDRTYDQEINSLLHYRCATVE